MEKAIEITCEGATTLPLEELQEFRGELKSITPHALAALKQSILNLGFSAPIFIWPDPESRLNHVIDGKQRMRALAELRDEGYVIPPLPVAYIAAASHDVALVKLLHISSQYGDFAIDAVFDSMAEAGLNDCSTLRLVNEELILDARFLEPDPDDADLDDYQEPPQTFLVCPHCGERAEADKFEKVVEE